VRLPCRSPSVTSGSAITSDAASSSVGTSVVTGGGERLERHGVDGTDDAG
jgi:hypothetical protein